MTKGYARYSDLPAGRQYPGSPRLRPVTASVYNSNSQVTNVMRAKNVKSTKNWSAAVYASSAGASDDEIEKILKGEDTPVNS
jgi:hypothetical protein